MAAKTTRAEDIAAAVRVEILAGRLRPGEQLKFQAFASQFNASIGVMREAFSKLVELGLAEAEPHLGYRVKTLSYSELHDLTEARMQIESLVFEDAIRNGTLQWEADIIAAHYVLEQTPLRDPADPSSMSDDWSAAHERFHAALLAACSNQRLLAFAGRLREEAELYRRWSVSLDVNGHRDVAAEHRRLLELATARTTGQAGEALRAHIARTTDQVLEGASDTPPRRRADAEPGRA